MDELKLRCDQRKHNISRLHMVKKENAIILINLSNSTPCGKKHINTMTRLKFTVSMYA
jgi:hypothetical protein